MSARVFLFCVLKSFSSMDGLNFELFLALNHLITSVSKEITNRQSLNEWSMESFSPQYRQSSSGLIPKRHSSLLVTTCIMW